MKINALTLLPLISLVVGSMIGTGIFDFPKNIATYSGAFAIVIGWIISGIGMLSLALTFLVLNKKKCNIQGSIYGYAKEGFGDYFGFNAVFGYWISALIGNVAYLVIIFSALGYFFSIFGKGNNFISIVCESLLLWITCLFILRGVKIATIVNLILTVAKTVPLIFFILSTIYFFNWDIFKENLFPKDLGSITEQIKHTMLVTVFLLIGIEGATIYSSRAKKQSDVGLATVIGFIITVMFLILISVLSLGIISRSDLISLQTPSLAGIFSKSVGYVGIIIVNIGLIISASGALLAWLLIACEIPFLASKDNNFPRLFNKVNTNSIPIHGLIVASIITQAFLLVSYFFQAAYYLVINLCASMVLVPYLLTSLFFLKQTVKSKLKKKSKVVYFSNLEFILSIISVVYGIWIIYAGGILYLLFSMVLYGLGFFIYLWAKVESKEPLLRNKKEKVLLAVIVILFIIGLTYIIKHLATLTLTI